MNNQFATQFLREDQDQVNASIKNVLAQTGADKDLVDFIMNAIRQGVLTPEKAIQIIKDTFRGMNEDGGAAAAPAGGSTTGGGVTNGATFTPGAGEQYAAGTRKKKYQEDASQGDFKVGSTVKYNNQDWKIINFLDNGTVRLQSLKGLPSTTIDKAVLSRENPGVKTEDAPRLAGSPAKTNKQGAKNLSAYGSVGFTKAPSATEAGKHMKSIDVIDLWDEDPLNESRAYSRFKKETALRSKPDQMHEAAKIIQNKLHEIEKLLEFTSQMRSELSEGEQTLEYKHNTKRVFEKIHSKVVEVYTKVKGLK